MRAQFSVWSNVLVEVFLGDYERKVNEIRTRNMWVKTGRNKVRDILMYPDADTSPSPAYAINYIAVGTNATATSDTTETLGTEVYRDEITRKSPNDSGFVLQLYIPTSQANGNTLRECGIFSKATGGTLWSRATHSDIFKSVSISVIYNWTVTIATG